MQDLVDAVDAHRAEIESANTNYRTGAFEWAGRTMVLTDVQIDVPEGGRSKVPDAWVGPVVVTNVRVVSSSKLGFEVARQGEPEPEIFAAFMRRLRQYHARHPDSLARFLPWPLRWIARRRQPAKVIGGLDDPYMVRWHILPANRWCNVYLHLFLRSDDDRALHDHPYRNASLLLHGEYLEHLPGGVVKHRRPGAVYTRPAEALHRVELIDHGPVWTLFFVWKRVRDWGFMCPGGRWVPWREFTAGPKGETIGRGCAE